MDSNDDKEEPEMKKKLTAVGTFRTIASMMSGPASVLSDERILSAAFDINTLNRASLEENLRKRGLDASGSKTELRQRLLDWISERVEGQLAKRAAKTADRIRQTRLEEAGSVYACGVNHRGQLGMGNNDACEVFTCIPELRGKGVDMVSAGTDYAFAVTETRQVYAWGGGGVTAPLGLGDSGAATPATPGLDDYTVPRIVERLRGEGVIDLSAGFGHVLAVAEGGDLFAWGAGRSGQLGTGTFAEAPQPMPVAALEDSVVDSVCVGHSHSLALLATGEVRVWGCGDSGRLGLGATERVGVPDRYKRFFPAPTPLPIGTTMSKKPRVKQIACSATHSIALIEALEVSPMENMVYVWGSGASYKLGLGDTSDRLEPTPLEAFRGERVLEVACSVWTSAAIVEAPPLLRGGYLYTWGTGISGQLGLGATIQKAKVPTLVEGLVEDAAVVRHVHLGPHHSAALTTDSRLYTWGSNRYGCLGAEIVDEMAGFPQLVRCFDCIMDGIGRGSIRSVALGTHFTIVACYPFLGPSAEEAQELQAVQRAGGDPKALLSSANLLATRPSAASLSRKLSRLQSKGSLGDPDEPVQLQKGTSFLDNLS